MAAATERFGDLRNIHPRIFGTQRILDHPGVSITSYQFYLAHLNLGRAYVLQGDKAKARTAYQDFFAAWKDADPDVPILVQARAEYAKLE